MQERNPLRNDEAQPETGPQQDKLGQIESLGTILPVGKDSSPIHCLTIVGQIEGHMVLPPHNKTTKYEHILPMLIAIEENPDIKGFLVLLNTVGGDVEAGLAIAEMIAGMQKPSVSLVLGGGHSIGVPLAVSARRSFIAPTATMTVHPIRMTGLVLGVSQTYDYLTRMQERVVSFVCQHSRIQRDRFMALMQSTDTLANDIGTILVGEDAVKCGLIDRMGSLHQAMECLRDLIAQEEKPCSTPS